jgi:very-short-patch-repair endonuclease
VNLPVADSSGRYAFRADLAYPVQRLIIEYQGDYHRERSQWRADMTRRGQLEALGWRVLEVNAADLARPTELCSRIRRILVLLA